MLNSSSMTTSQISGVIRDIDLVNRQLSLGGCVARSSVDVPPGCRILLRGEPVKLRMLQPGDYIRVTLSALDSRSVAHQIEVQGHRPLLAERN